MSGILGILDTDLLFAEPGTSQPEYWRLAQGTLGIGSLRTLGLICKTPCFEFLHSMHGIKPPEAVEAREFWLRQEAWTEINALNMGQEDTSYHRINQGSGSQGKLLWNWEEIEAERKLWSKAATRENSSPKLEKGEPVLSFANFNNTRAVPGEDGEETSQGTTDKWWMDRWQIEALAVASARNLTLEEASDLLTLAYFGTSKGRTQQLLAGLSCTAFTVATFLTAWYTNWSWIPQFLALSCLGYLVNWTASLRGWKFEPANADAVRQWKPETRTSWPTDDQVQGGEGAVRIAVQSSGFSHLRGVIVVPKNILDVAIQVAGNKTGRYKISQKNELKKPYSEEQTAEQRHWISFEAQASFYGLFVSIEPDNVKRRSIGVLWTMVHGIVLLILGFGASIAKGWSGYVLLFYLAGIGTAILGRRQGAIWTLPEFARVDFTTNPMKIPQSMEMRVAEMRDAETMKPLAKIEVRGLDTL